MAELSARRTSTNWICDTVIPCFNSSPTRVNSQLVSLPPKTLVIKLLLLLASRAWDRAPYSWNMVNLFLFGCHVTERTYASTDCTGRVGETIKTKGGVSQACLGESHLLYWTFTIWSIDSYQNRNILECFYSLK